jgi:hypothetical protein
MCFAAKVTRVGSCPTFHKGQRLNTVNALQLSNLMACLHRLRSLFLSTVFLVFLFIFDPLVSNFVLSSLILHHIDTWTSCL